MQGDCLELMQEIPSGSIDLVLTDPPYIGMLNEKWDRLKEQEAVEMFDKFKEESFRVLRYGGRLVTFSSNDTLKYLYGGKLTHRELLIVPKDVKSTSAGRNTKQYRQHVNCTEYVFVATKYARSHTRNLLLTASNGMSSKEINKALGVGTNGGGMWSIYTGNNVCNQVPTKDMWNKFCAIFEGLPDYSSFEEVFNNSAGLSNILPVFNFRFKGREHPAQKPIELIEYLLKLYSNEKFVVLDSFMGSGTTGVAALNLGRKFIGMEKDEGYFTIAKNRIEQTGVKL